MTTSIFDTSRVPTVHGTVWYPMDFSRGQVIAELPDDLDPRLLPPGTRSRFQGLLVCPKTGLSAW